jgi:hypothetical protein
MLRMRSYLTRSQLNSGIGRHTQINRCYESGESSLLLAASWSPARHQVRSPVP